MRSIWNLFLILLLSTTLAGCYSSSCHSTITEETKETTTNTVSVEKNSENAKVDESAKQSQVTTETKSDTQAPQTSQ